MFCMFLYVFSGPGGGFGGPGGGFSSLGSSSGLPLLLLSLKPPPGPPKPAQGIRQPPPGPSPPMKIMTPHHFYRGYCSILYVDR